jgi:putative SOS response-associated peptidase YedK
MFGSRLRTPKHAQHLIEQLTKGPRSDPLSARYTVRFFEARPLAVYAGIWTTWRGTKAKPVESEDQLFGFLTTDANAEVGVIHPKAMPVRRSDHLTIYLVTLD